MGYNKNKRIEERLRGRRKGGERRECHYADVNPLVLQEVLELATRQGDAIVLGRTRDGGAYHITILAGNERVKIYPTTAEEFDSEMRAIVDAYRDAPAEAAEGEALEKTVLEQAQSARRNGRL